MTILDYFTKIMWQSLAVVEHELIQTAAPLLREFFALRDTKLFSAYIKSFDLIAHFSDIVDLIPEGVTNGI